MIVSRFIGFYEDARNPRSQTAAWERSAMEALPPAPNVSSLSSHLSALGRARLLPSFHRNGSAGASSSRGPGGSLGARCICFCWALVAACVMCCRAIAGTPSLEAITPQVGTRGSSFTVVAKGASLKDTRSVVFYDSGLRCEKIEAKNDDEIKIEIKAEAYCTLGPHPFRLLTDEGFSELRTLTISPFPTVLENKDADTQSVQPNTTIVGALESDDVDVYQIQAKVGNRISAEAVAVRLGATLLDTVLTLRDPSGRVLVRVDDTPMLNQDPAFSVVAKEAGLYTVEITSAGANADVDSQYALHIGSFPRPFRVFPLGARAGAELDLEITSSISDQADSSRKKISLDSGLIGTREVELMDAGVVCPSPILMRINTYDQAFVDLHGTNKSEPEAIADLLGGGSASASGSMEVPVAFHGVIKEAAEVDSFRFSVHQTGMISLEVFASRLGSLLDSVVEVQDQSGQTVCSGDDFESHDSRLVFEAKVGDRYTAFIRDKRKNAGAAYSYCVEIAPLQSSLTAFLPRRSKLSQGGQTISVPRGNRSLGLIGLQRDRIDGEVRLAFQGLPQGASTDCPPVSSSLFVVPAVFNADTAASTVGSLVAVQASLGSGSGGISTGGFEQVVDLVNGPADAIFQPAKVDRLGVAITNPVPYSIELAKPTVSLAADGTLGITVHVKRDPGFDAPIDITFPLLPEWIDCEAKTRIAGNQDSATILLRSNRLASAGVFPIVAEGTPGLSDVGSRDIADPTMPRIRSRRPSVASFVPVASSLHTLNIATSPVRGSIVSVSAERGSQVDLECKLEFDEFAPDSLIASLEGLPNRTQAEPVAVRSSDKRVRFKLVIGEDAPTGTFGQIVCRLSGTSDSQPVSFCVARDSKLIISAPGGSQKDDSGRPLSQLEALRRRRSVKGGS